jgi:2-polyprenyl-3-methyl-5-hydroxy-6-metoxy-1,4-benzoquinol methylase
MTDKLKDTYNKIAKEWHEDHQNDTWWKEGTDAFIAHLKPGATVLDVGCAGGTKSSYLTNKGLNVTGIDISNKLIDIAKQEVPGANFLVLDVHQIDTLKEKFDAIFMQAVLLHFPKSEIQDILSKATGLLNDGGYLYVAVKEKIDGGIEEEVKVDDDYGFEYERFFSYFTLNDFKQYFKNVGLEIVFKDILPPSRTARKSNWMQIIGKKLPTS